MGVVGNDLHAAARMEAGKDGRDDRDVANTSFDLKPSLLQHTVGEIWIAAIQAD